MDKKETYKHIPGTDGTKIPENYFEEFAQRLESRLPEHEQLVPEQAPRSTWQRIRPYVYMAAMFAGVWCMLKMFMLMGASTETSLNIDENPALARVVEDEQFVEDYVIDDLSNWDIYNSMLEDSVDVYNLVDSVYNSHPDSSLPDDTQINDVQ